MHHQQYCTRFRAFFMSAEEEKKNGMKVESFTCFFVVVPNNSSFDFDEEN